MKTLLFTTAFLLSGLLYAQQDLNTIAKEIPLKKVSNVQIQNGNDAWCTFQYKEGFGLWDIPSKKAVILGAQPYYTFTPQEQETAIIYTEDSIFIYNRINNAMYGAAFSDTLYHRLSEGRFEVNYYSYGNMRFKDTLKDIHLDIETRSKEFILQLSDADKKRHVYVINRKAHEAKIELTDCYFYAYASGFKALQEREMDPDTYMHERYVIFFDTNYRKLNDPILETKLSDPAVLSKIVGCPVDSIDYNQYGGSYYRCNGKWGAYSREYGKITEPTYDMVLRSGNCDIYLENNRLGAVIPEVEFSSKPNYSSVGIYGSSGDYCGADIWMDDELYATEYWDCEVLSNVYRVENSEEKPGIANMLYGAFIKGDYLINNYGFRAYHTGEGSPTEYDWWYTNEGQSGIYSLSQKKWIVAPDKFKVVPFGDNFVVCNAYPEEFPADYFILNTDLVNEDPMRYVRFDFWNNYAFLTDTNGVTFKMDLNGNIEFFNDSIGDSELLRFGDYLVFGSSYYDDWSYREEFTPTIIYDADLNVVEFPANHYLGTLADNDYVVIGDFSNYDENGGGNVTANLFDLRTRKVVMTWQDYYEISNDGKLQIGFEGDPEYRVIDLKTLREEAKHD